MTQSKREPFVKAVQVYERNWGILLSTRPVRGIYGPKGSIEDFVEDINAAFNARVDEEERKAVEKFRERAEIVVRQECGGKCGGDRGCEISRKIMEIPTEPEVK